MKCLTEVTGYLVCLNQATLQQGNLWKVTENMTHWQEHCVPHNSFLLLMMLSYDFKLCRSHLRAVEKHLLNSLVWLLCLPRNDRWYSASLSHPPSPLRNHQYLTILFGAPRTQVLQWQQQKTITPQGHSHCTDICKEKQHLTIFGPVTPNWATSLYPCAKSHEISFVLPRFWFLFWGDSLGGFPFSRFLCFTLSWSRQSSWRCFHLISTLLHKCALVLRLHWD